MRLLQRIFSLLGFGTKSISSIDNKNSFSVAQSINETVFELPVNDIKEHVEQEPYLYVQPETYPVLLKPLTNISASYNEHIERTDKGVLEDYFFDYARKEFGGKFKNDVQVKLPEYTLTPDFAYIDAERKLYIIIEIDEPYSINSQSDFIPIHYVGLDDVKNKMFIQQGWHIIRFAEEQVATFPRECVTFISRFLLSSSIYTIHSVKCWSKEESLEMIKQSYRNNYLPFRFNHFSNLDSKNSYRRFQVFEIKGITTKAGEFYVVVSLILSIKRFEDESCQYDTRDCFITEDTFWDKMNLLGISFLLNKRRTNQWLNARYRIYDPNIYFEGYGQITPTLFQLTKSNVFSLIIPKEHIWTEEEKRQFAIRLGL